MALLPPAMPPSVLTISLSLGVLDEDFFGLVFRIRGTVEDELLVVRVVLSGLDFGCTTGATFCSLGLLVGPFSILVGVCFSPRRRICFMNNFFSSRRVGSSFLESHQLLITLKQDS